MQGNVAGNSSKRKSSTRSPNRREGGFLSIFSTNFRYLISPVVLFRRNAASMGQRALSKSEFVIEGGELHILDLSMRNKIELKLFGRSKFANLALNKSCRGEV